MPTRSLAVKERLGKEFLGEYCWVNKIVSRHYAGQKGITWAIEWEVSDYWLKYLCFEIALNKNIPRVLSLAKLLVFLCANGKSPFVLLLNSDGVHLLSCGACPVQCFSLDLWFWVVASEAVNVGTHKVQNALCTPCPTAQSGNNKVVWSNSLLLAPLSI